MSAIRGRARSGGLTVAGTVIHQPPDAPSATFEEGSEEEADHRAAVARIDLWNELVEDTSSLFHLRGGAGKRHLVAARHHDHLRERLFHSLEVDIALPE